MERPHAADLNGARRIPRAEPRGAPSCTASNLSDELLAVTAAAEPWRFPERPDIAAAFLADITEHIFRRSVWLGPMLWESPLPNPSRRLENRAHAAACKAKGVCVRCSSADLHPDSTILCRRHLQRQRRSIRKRDRRAYAARRAMNVCVKCSAELDPDSTILCTRHLEIQRRSQRKRAGNDVTSVR